MKNHDKIYEYVKSNQGSIKSVFTYQRVMAIAKIACKATASGLDYASLKFLQKYCAIDNDIGDAKTSFFVIDDPRKYDQLADLKKNWKFSLQHKYQCNLSLVDEGMADLTKNLSGEKMTNQDKICEYIKSNPDSIKNVFTYQHVMAIAKMACKATASGLDYASLKFLQKYCARDNDIGDAETSFFVIDDPRKYDQLANLKKNWKFRLQHKYQCNLSLIDEESAELNNKKTDRSAKDKELCSIEMTKNGYLGNVDVTSFTKYLADLINGAAFEHKYIIEKGGKNAAWIKYNKNVDRIWQCTNLQSALEQYFWGNSNFDSNNRLLNDLTSRLENAMDRKNDKDVLSICLNILEWGGVSNGAYGVALSYCNDKLISSITSALAALTPGPDTPLELKEFKGTGAPFIMNASFTKIYSIWSKKPFIIYDSRVAAALSLIVKNYWISSRKDNTVLPPLLKFACLEGRAKNAIRCAADKDMKIEFSKVKNGEDHALWNVRANWIIEAALIKSDKSDEDMIKNMRELEAALFMIGYNVAT